MFKHVEQLVWVSGLEIIDVGRIALTGGRHSPGITTSSEHLNLFFASADVLDIGHTHDLVDLSLYQASIFCKVTRLTKEL